jgi:hypothetical protein
LSIGHGYSGVANVAELTSREVWFIDVYFKHHHGFGGSHNINEMKHFMLPLLCGPADAIIKSLIAKKVLSVSPDGNKVKFTDHGLGLYRSLQSAQQEWEKQPVIRVNNLTKEQILVTAGETFTANRILREIISQAHSRLRIIDPYIGAEILDLVQDIGLSPELRVITSSRASATAISACKAFQTQYKDAEFRVATDKIHDRYVICNESTAYHLGHSLKDLGKKDTQVSVQRDVGQVIRLFEERWAKAKSV